MRKVLGWCGGEGHLVSFLDHLTVFVGVFPNGFVLEYSGPSVMTLPGLRGP